jgi:hypothetical protein
VLIGCDEFPVGYSLTGCPPAEPVSASPAENDSQQTTLPYNDFSANGNYPLNFVSQSKGAVQKKGNKKRERRAKQRTQQNENEDENRARELKHWEFFALWRADPIPKRLAPC